MTTPKGSAAATAPNPVHAQQDPTRPIAYSLLHPVELTMFETDFPDSLNHIWAPPGGRINFQVLKCALNKSLPYSAFKDHNLGTPTGQALANFLGHKYPKDTRAIPLVSSRLSSRHNTPW